MPCYPTSPERRISSIAPCASSCTRRRAVVGIELGQYRRGDLAGLCKLAAQLVGAGIGVGLSGGSRGAAPAEQPRDREPGQDPGDQRGGAARVRSCSVRVRHEDDTILRLYSLHFLPRPAPTFPRGARDGGAA